MSKTKKSSATVSTSAQARLLGLGLVEFFPPPLEGSHVIEVTWDGRHAGCLGGPLMLNEHHVYGVCADPRGQPGLKRGSDSGWAVIDPLKWEPYPRRDGETVPRAIVGIATDRGGPGGRRCDLMRPLHLARLGMKYNMDVVAVLIPSRGLHVPHEMWKTDPPNAIRLLPFKSYLVGYGAWLIWSTRDVYRETPVDQLLRLPQMP